MKPLTKASAVTVAVLTLFVTGCTTYDRTTTDWRHPSPIWNPEPTDPQATHVSIVKLPEAPYAGKRFDQLSSGSPW